MYRSGNTEAPGWQFCWQLVILYLKFWQECKLWSWLFFYYEKYKPFEVFDLQIVLEEAGRVLRQRKSGEIPQTRAMGLSPASLHSQRTLQQARCSGVWSLPSGGRQPRWCQTACGPGWQLDRALLLCYSKFMCNSLSMGREGSGWWWYWTGALSNHTAKTISPFAVQPQPSD